MRTVTIIFRNVKKERTYFLTKNPRFFGTRKVVKGLGAIFYLIVKLPSDTQRVVLPSPPVRVQPVSRIE